LKLIHLWERNSSSRKRFRILRVSDTCPKLFLIVHGFESRGFQNLIPSSFVKVRFYGRNFLPQTLEIFTAMKIHEVVFWVKAPCSDVVGYQRF